MFPLNSSDDLCLLSCIYPSSMIKPMWAMSELFPLCYLLLWKFHPLGQWLWWIVKGFHYLKILLFLKIRRPSTLPRQPPRAASASLSPNRSRTISASPDRMRRQVKRTQHSRTG